MTTKEMVEKLRDFSVPELCDGMEEPRVIDYQVKPLAAGRRNEKAHTDEPGVHQEKYKLRGSRRPAGADTLFMAGCK